MGKADERYEGEVVALTRDCDLGCVDELAVVLRLVQNRMTLVFFDRPLKDRVVRTGADYQFLRSK